MNKYFINHCSIILLTVFMTACSSTKEDEEVLGDPKDIYNEASSLLNQNKYEESAKKFEALEREHPASEYAGAAQVRRAYAKYLDGKFDDAILIIEEFIKQYPANSSTPYMYYLRGLCYYDQIVDIGRDQELSQKTIAAFEELINRFPNSEYAKDARLKIDYAFSSLAGKEMEIGRFYLKKSNYVAALGRFKTVVDSYQTSIFTPEALYRLTEVYYILGDVNQAQVYASVLGHNYPNNEWYIKAYDLVINNKSEDKIPWYENIKKIW